MEMTNYIVTERPNGLFEVTPRTRPDGLRSEYEKREDAQRRADYLNWAQTYSTMPATGATA